MKVSANLAVLQQAFSTREASELSRLIHHSDRGSQYGAKLYTQCLLNAGAKISMGKKAQENAYAERVKGIIKNEYLCYKHLTSFQSVKREVRKAVRHYNQHRIHNHLPYNMTPIQFEQALKQKKRPKTPWFIIHAMNRPDISQIKSAKLPNLIHMEKNDLYGYCPLTNNHLFFNNNGQP